MRWALLLCLCAYQPDTVIRQSPPPAWVEDADIVRIKDGDTAVFEIKRTFSVRYLDCWCAETNSKDPVERKLGIEAEQYVQKLKQQNPGKWRVEVPLEGVDEIGDVLTFGRVLALVYLPDGRCVNDLLVELKLAGRTKGELAELIEERRE